MSRNAELSSKKAKFIRSLQMKKFRKQEQCFVVEGAKSVQELLNSSFNVVMVVGTGGFLETAGIPAGTEVIEVSTKILEGLGEFQSNSTALAIGRMKTNDPILPGEDEFSLMLDDIRDPGNLGTVIRTADWYGIKKIIASEETADCYSSKVITATMGSFVRVQLYYTSLTQYLREKSRRVFGAFLDGQDVHSVSFGTGGMILLGNESRGISPSLDPYITDRITIPRYGKAESLNAAIAAGIICDNLRRSTAGISSPR